MSVKKEEIILARKAFLSVGLPSQKSSYGEGANLTVEVFLRGHIDPATDLVVNLTDVETVLAQMRNEFDHKHFAFDFSVKSKTEAAALLRDWLSQRLQFPNCRLVRVDVRFGEFQCIQMDLPT